MRTVKTRKGFCGQEKAAAVCGTAETDAHPLDGETENRSMAGIRIAQNARAKTMKERRKGWSAFFEKGGSQDLVFYMVLLLTAWFLIWKCRYGFGNRDEAFYLSVPLRLLQGDALLVHEWHPSQMAGVLSLPVVWILRMLCGGTDGIILAMRYATVALLCALSLYVYHRLKTYSRIGAACGAISLALYVPYGITALSYNSMGIMLMVFSGVTMLGDTGHRHSLVLSGFSYAAACLCCPYLVAVYVLYLAAVGLRALCFRAKRCRREAGSAVIWRIGWFTAGIAAAAVLFAAFVFSRASFADVVQALPHILEDPEHQPIPMTSRVADFFRVFLTATRTSAWMYMLLAVLLLLCCLDRKRDARKGIYFGMAWGCTVVLMVSHAWQLRYLNMLMWSINVLGLMAALLSGKRSIRQLFAYLWVPGMLYAFCINISSNQRFYAISSASSVACLGSMVMCATFLQDLARERRTKKRSALAWGMLVIVLALQVTTQAQLRLTNLFWEGSMTDQTVLLEDGPEAGLLVTKQKAEAYEADLAEIRQMEEEGYRRILFLSSDTWDYLMGDFETCGYSAWLSGINEMTLWRLQAYYQLHEEKMPEAVYANLENMDIALRFSEMFDYRIERTTDRSILLIREDAVCS